MRVDPVIRQLARTMRKKLKYDPERPYKMRRQKGDQGSRGQTEYEHFTLNNIMTQPLGKKEIDRMEEGLRFKTWRFVAVFEPEDGETWLKTNDEIKFGDEWFQVKKLNTWPVIQGGNMVVVE